MPFGRGSFLSGKDTIYGVNTLLRRVYPILLYHIFYKKSIKYIILCDYMAFSLGFVAKFSIFDAFLGNYARMALKPVGFSSEKYGFFEIITQKL